jgi:hypothetical protein
MAALDPKNPEQDFVMRTRELVDNYNNPDREFTHLLNCLMGLVIVPKETMLAALPASPISAIQWGLEGPPVVQWGQCSSCKGATTQDLKTLVTKIRHATAHFQIKCIADMTIKPAKWKSVEFEARRNFKAVFSYDQLKQFVCGITDELQKAFTAP